MQQLPEHGSCFVCGKQNPHSIGVTWYLDDNGDIYTEVIFADAQQGPPAHVHGGASAAVLDEAMGAAYSVVAVNLEINYSKPVPLGQKIVVQARIAEVHPRKILTVSEMHLPDGTVAVTGRGIYVEAPQLFRDVSFG
jgi:acyl-coenzyme A thioesterase PaaI-like protein